MQVGTSLKALDCKMCMYVTIQTTRLANIRDIKADESAGDSCPRDLVSSGQLFLPAGVPLF